MNQKLSLGRSGITRLEIHSTLDFRVHESLLDQSRIVYIRVFILVLVAIFTFRNLPLSRILHNLFLNPVDDGFADRSLLFLVPLPLTT
jgi:hypothetical protein